MEIVVIKYKNPEAEEKCLESVERFTDLTKHTLTVFDNAEAGNINLGKLWNQLIKESKDEVICLLNSDCVVEEGWTEMEKRALMDGVGAVGPVTDNCGTSQKGMSKTDRQEEINDLSGFCYVFRKSVWKEVGGFPEDFPFYGQESVFNRKLQDRGYKLMVDRRVFVSHEKGSSFKKALAEGEPISDEAEWGAFHYYNYLDRLKILRSTIGKDFKIIVIGGGRGNEFPLHKGIQQATDEFFGANALLLNADACLTEIIDIFRPDLILNTETKYGQLVEDFLRYAKKEGIKTALYYNDMRCPITDACLPPENLCKNLTDIYDALFICNEGHKDCWEINAKVPTFYMPQGSIQHPKPKQGTNYGILHIGSEAPGYFHQNRYALLKDLRRKVEVVNRNDPNRDRRLKIQNESYADYHASDYSLAISMNVEKYTSDRLYTITGSGGCAIAFQPGKLDEIFKHKEHVIFFKSVRDLLKTLESMTEEERNKIKLNAFKHTQKHHLYKNRLLNILQNLYTEDKSFHGDLNNLYKIGK